MYTCPPRTLTSLGTAVVYFVHFDFKIHVCAPAGTRILDEMNALTKAMVSLLNASALSLSSSRQQELCVCSAVTFREAAKDGRSEPLTVVCHGSHFRSLSKTGHIEEIF